jgi:hypothetical protein
MMSRTSEQAVAHELKRLAKSCGFDLDCEALLSQGFLKKRPYPATPEGSPVSWERVLTELEQRMPLSQLQAWIVPLQLYDMREDRLVLWAPNDFSAQWVRDHHRLMIIETIQGLYPVHSEYTVEILSNDPEI